MAAATPAERPAKNPGRLSKALTRLLMKSAVVAAVEQVAERFMLVTLEGPALRGAAFAPGQKVQVAMGSAFVARTYTPIEWDAAAGRTRILGYAHGEGPGSAWLRALAPGARCDLFGPRASLDIGRLAGRLAVFGDETSLGLACSLARQDAARAVTCCFEVEDPAAARHVADRLALGDATLLARRADGGQIDDMEAVLPALASAGASFVLTGNAVTVQRLRHALKARQVPAGRILTKAYWAPGKTGLD